MRRAVTFLIVLLACPCAITTTLMGPSTALLDGDRLGLSVEYSRTEADVTFDLDAGRTTEDFDFDTTYALFSAATQWWEFFLRVRVARADATSSARDASRVTVPASVSPCGCPSAASHDTVSTPEPHACLGHNLVVHPW